MLEQIAIIDDCPEDRELYKYYLGKLSDQLKFVEFEQGQEALKGLDDPSIQCVLLDFNLPDMNALELLSQYGARRDIPIILLTGQGNEFVAVDAFKLGVCDYIIKSTITEESLLTSVQNAIEKYNSKKNLESKNREMLFEASHDCLTHLYNRKYLEDYSQKIIAKCKRHHQKFALLYIDLDRFKHINDSLGHQIGDKLLIEFSERMLQNFREDDLICRIGGDEFIVLMDNVGQPHTVATVAQKILKAASKTFHIEHLEINIGASIGIYYYDDNEDINFESILKKADKALYSAKEKGKNSFQFFSDALEASYKRKIYLEKSIKQALAQNHFHVFFQPQYNLRTKKIIGLEALLRWFDPGLGEINPTEFIPIAEETRIINDIGYWTLYEIFHMLKNMQIPSSCTVSVNLSLVQLQNSKFIPKLIEIFKKDMDLLRRIEFEVTESSLIDGDVCVFESLKSIKNLGCTLAIDRFAMGCSSFYHLSQADFSTLKVDHSYVKDLCQNQLNLNFLRFAKSLSDSLGAKIIYVGIENREDQVILEKIDHSYGQGYYFQEPAPIEEIVNLF